MSFSDRDRTVLRDLAHRVSEIANDDVMAGRRRNWVEHNSLRSTYPMMLIFPEGGWCELLDEANLLCQDDSARGIEVVVHRFLEPGNEPLERI